MPADLFTIRHPPAGTTRLPIVANLPHSGLQVPDAIAAQFTPEHLSGLPNSDWHLQQLYRFLPELGITVMQANYSRYVVDLNRALKPPFFGSFWSAVVPESTAFKQPIYQGEKPSKAAVRERIDEFYTPYHQRLAGLLNEAIAEHSLLYNQVYLLDLHSFMGLITDDVCLGNANGKTCQTEFIEATARSFVKQGYQTVINKVFTGGYITRHYGQYPNIEALQIEIRYPIYLPADQLAADQPADQPADQLEVQSISQPIPQPIPEWQGLQFEQAQAHLKNIFQDICADIKSAKHESA